MLDTERNLQDCKTTAEHTTSSQLNFLRCDVSDTSRDAIPLGDLPRILRSMTGKRAPYQKIYRLAVDGDLPLEKTDQGRWVARRGDIPAIAEILKLI
jgi:hypothetical protein